MVERTKAVNILKMGTSVDSPLLEKLLEESTPNIADMKTHYETLLERMVHEKTPKSKAAYQKAAKAYERFIELLTYLLKVKADLLSKQVDSAKSKSSR